jgi:Co/Zn/Cd efflux system component
LIAARSGAMIIWRGLSLADPVFSVVISILIIFSS